MSNSKKSTSFLAAASLIILILSASLSRGYGQIFPSFGKTRVGTTGMQFLKVWADPRSSGMAGTTHAFINDAAALYWNPAGITQVDSAKLHIQTDYTQYFAGISNSFAGLVFRKDPHHYFGFQVQSFNSGSMNVTTEFNPTGTGQKYSVNSFIIGGTYAQILTDNFSYGVSAKYAREGIAYVATNNILFDLAFQYNVGWQDIRFSVGVSNFGVNVKPDGTVKVLKTTGDQVINNYEDISVPAAFRVGVSKKFIKTKDHTLLGAIQLNHPTDNAENYSLGIEYGLKNTLFVRTGVQTGVQSDFPSFGFGLRAPKNWGAIRIDYSFNNYQNLGNIHRLGLNFQLVNL